MGDVGLYFIGYEQYIMGMVEVVCFVQVFFIGYYYVGFVLNWFNYEVCYVVILQGFFQCRKVIVWDDFVFWYIWLKVSGVVGICGGGNCFQGMALEVVGDEDDFSLIGRYVFDFVGLFLVQFNGCFVFFYVCIYGQYVVVVEEFGDKFFIRLQYVIVEGLGSQSELFCLFFQCFYDMWVVMFLIDSGIGCKEVVVFFIFDVLEVSFFFVGEYYRQWVVIVCVVVVF